MPLRRYSLYLWMMILLTACNLDQSSQTAIPATLPPGTPHLVTAWAEGGNLYVWRTGDAFARRIASGGVIQPFVSPDGDRIAFTRGPAGAPDSLWLVMSTGAQEQQLVREGSPGTYLNAQIGQVLWWDATTLYFNTLQRAVPASTPRHDLYIANVITRTASQILGPGEGGRISFSPSHQKIALIKAGEYGKNNGRIRVIDPLAQLPSTDLLFFTGVATGGHSGFYPPVVWIEDETALLTAVPEQDLLYAEDQGEEMPATAIWHLPIGEPSNRQVVGSIMASFFGMPRWSEDGTQMLYLTRPNSETFQIMLADGLGENAQEIDTGKAGEIEMPAWIPGTSQFFYSKNEAGHVLIASDEDAPRALSNQTILAPHFIRPTQYVFIAPQGEGYELLVALDDQSIQTIGQISSMVVFDAVWVTP